MSQGPSSKWTTILTLQCPLLSGASKYFLTIASTSNCIAEVLVLLVRQILELLPNWLRGEVHGGLIPAPVLAPVDPPQAQKAQQRRQIHPEDRVLCFRVVRRIAKRLRSNQEAPTVRYKDQAIHGRLLCVARSVGADEAQDQDQRGRGVSKDDVIRDELADTVCCRALGGQPSHQGDGEDAEQDGQTRC